MSLSTYENRTGLPAALERRPLQVAVVGKGGVGKTTVAAGLMKCLAERGMRVLAVDADPTALLRIYLGAEHGGTRRTVGRILEEAREGVRSGMVRRPREEVASAIQRSLLRTPYGDLLTMGAPGGRGCYCAANSALRTAIRDISHIQESTVGSPPRWGQPGYDLLLVDCEPGLEIFSRGTLDGTDVLVVVAEPTAAGLAVAAQIWQSARDLGLPAISSTSTRGGAWPLGACPVLLNKLQLGDLPVSDDFPEGTYLPVPPNLQRLLATHQLQARWLVPHDPLVADAVEEGLPVVAAPLDSPFMQGADVLAAYLVGLAHKASSKASLPPAHAESAQE